MANTLKLGAGKWATGTDTVLAFNDKIITLSRCHSISVEHQVLLLLINLV